jgi:hypothetical protein
MPVVFTLSAFFFFYFYFAGQDRTGIVLDCFIRAFKLDQGTHHISRALRGLMKVVAG